MLYARPKPLLYLLLLFAAAILGGCTSTPAPPGKSELSAIDTGEMTLLLLRVAASIKGEAHEPFSAALADDNIGIGLGTFETGGQAKPSGPWRFFSEDSRAQGWTYLSVPPGILYFAFLPPRRTHIIDYIAMFESAPLWRIDVPEKSKLVYVGTLAVDGESDFYLFGGKSLNHFKRMEIRDEREAAQALADRHVPGLGPIKTALMQRHDGPIILTTPTD